jgi:oligoendopeptidase F
MSETAYPRQFVPAGFDPSNWDDAGPLYDELRDRPIDSPQALERWLDDLSELTSVMGEYGNRRYIDKSCHTDNEAIKRRYLQFVEEIEPKVKPLLFAIQQRYLASPHAAALRAKDARYEILARQWQADVEIFRDENVPLQTQATQLVTEYDAICGDMTVNFRGEELTLQQAERFLQEPDRPTRQEAWELISDRRHKDREKIDDIFDRLLDLRTLIARNAGLPDFRARIARNAGLPDFRAYVWKEYKRFDYTPEQCMAFADAIARAVVPLMRDLDRQRQADLGLPSLRPWDMSVDPKNRPPLAPFGRDDTRRLVDGSRGIFERVSPALAEDFDSLSRRRRS